MLIPPKRPRPPLARWLFERDMTLREGAAYFETSFETLRRATARYDDPLMRPPHKALMQRIIDRTLGEVQPNDWYVQQVAA